MSNLNENYSLNLDAPNADALTDKLPILDNEDLLRIFDVTITDTEISFISPLNENITWTYEIVENSVVLSSNETIITNAFLGAVLLKTVDTINGISVIDFDELHYNGIHYKLSPKILNSIYYQAVEIPADILSAGQRVTVTTEEIYNFSRAINRVIKDDLKAETYLSFKEMQNKLQPENLKLDTAKEIKLTPGIASFIDEINSVPSTNILVRPSGDFVGFEALNVSVKPMLVKNIESLAPPPSSGWEDDYYPISLSIEEAADYSGFSEIRIKGLALQELPTLEVTKDTFKNSFDLTEDNKYFGAKAVALDIPLLSTTIGSDICSSFIEQNSTPPTIKLDINDFQESTQIGFSSLAIELPLRELTADEVKEALKENKDGIALADGENYVGFSIVNLPKVALAGDDSQTLEIKGEDLFTIISSNIESGNSFGDSNFFEIFNDYNEGFYNKLIIKGISSESFANHDKDMIQALEVQSSVELVESTISVGVHMNTIRNLKVYPIKSTCLNTSDIIDLGNYYSSSNHYSSNAESPDILKINANGTSSYSNGYFYPSYSDSISSDNEAFTSVNLILPKGIGIGISSNEAYTAMRNAKNVSTTPGPDLQYSNYIDINITNSSVYSSFIDNLYCKNTIEAFSSAGVPCILTDFSVSLPSVRDISLCRNLTKDLILNNCGTLSLNGYTSSSEFSTEESGSSYIISHTDQADFIDNVLIELPYTCKTEIDSDIISSCIANKCDKLIITNNLVKIEGGGPHNNAKYTVSFNLNGATGTAPAAQLITANNGLIYPEIPTRSDYIFAGWYTNSDCTGVPFDFSAEVTSNITLYAKWIKLLSPYNSILSIDGNTGWTSFNSSVEYYPFVSLVDQMITIYTSHTEGDPKIYLYNSNKTQLTSNDDGYGNYDSKITWQVTAGTLYYAGFSCYSSSSGTGIMYISGMATPPAGGKSTAGIKYTVRFDLNGATGTIPETQIVTETEGLSYPEERPERAGYIFAGWYTNRAGNGVPYNFSAAVTSDITLYAKWIRPTGNGTISINTISDELVFPGRYDTDTKNYNYYAFVPLVSGPIVIESESKGDAYGYLCDSNKKVLSYNDDSTGGREFKIEYQVTAGQLYYIVPCGYSTTIKGQVSITGGSQVPADGGRAAPDVILANLTNEDSLLSEVVINLPQQENYIFIHCVDSVIQKSIPTDYHPVKQLFGQDNITYFTSSSISDGLLFEVYYLAEPKPIKLEQFADLAEKELVASITINPVTNYYGYTGFSAKVHSSSSNLIIKTYEEYTDATDRSDQAKEAEYYTDFDIDKPLIFKASLITE